MNIATVVAVDAISAPNTSFVPLYALSSSLATLLRVRTIFSSTTIAASSTIPTAKAKPAREIMLSERPVICRTTKVLNKEMGMANATMSVARSCRINAHRIPMANSTPINRLLVTNCTAL